MSETYKSILDRMKNSLPENGASAIEGTFTGNNLQAVADELARIYSQDLDPLILRAFAVTAAGDDLQRVGDDIGVYRKDATYAEVLLRISGAPGSYGQVIAAADHILFLTDDFVIGKDGTADVRAVCQMAGAAGNVPAGAVREIKTQGVSLTAVINPDPAAGGYEAESEEGYRMRILDRKRKTLTGGNREQYRQWTLAVSGVSKAKVIDLYNGPGTVGIFIVADGNKAAAPDLIDRVSSYIETVRPCGAGITVMSAQALQIDITATVVLSAGSSTETVVEEYKELLQEFVGTVPFTNGKQIISYLKVANILLDVDGVEDVPEMTINGQDASVSLTELQFPALGTVVLQEA